MNIKIVQRRQKVLNITSPSRLIKYRYRIKFRDYSVSNEKILDIINSENKSTVPTSIP